MLGWIGDVRNIQLFTDALEQSALYAVTPFLPIIMAKGDSESCPRDLTALYRPTNIC